MEATSCFCLFASPATSATTATHSPAPAVAAPRSGPPFHQTSGKFRFG